MKSAAYAAVCMIGLLQASWVNAARWELALEQTSSPHLQTVVTRFAADLNTRTNGALQFAPRRHRTNTSLLKAVAGGAVAAAAIPLSLLAADDSLLAMDELPYLATSAVDARKLWQVVKPRVDSALSRRGLILLFAAPEPPTALLASRSLTKLADLRGMSWLGDAASLKPLTQLVGARAVNGRDLGPHFSAGKAQLASISATHAVEQQAWDFASHFYVTPAWFAKQLVVANRSAVVSLQRDVRDRLLTVADEAAKSSWDDAVEAGERGAQNLRDWGVKVREPDTPLLIELEQLGRNVLFTWSQSAGEEGALMVEQYYDIK